jgi:hypothetical protein
VGEHLAGGSDRVQRVALGAAAVRWPLGSTHLDDPLTTLQQRGQAGAEAARSLHRPQAAARNLTVGKAEQLLGAGGVGAGGGLGEHPAEVVTAAAVRVSRWVSTPMTPSTSSASMAMR